MKEYKLIKKYPGLPKDWEVGMIVGTGDRQGQACFSPCNGEYTDKHIDHNDVINNPEFWEETKKEHSLCYCDLKHGEYYTTEYSEQGLYTFKQGCNLWINHTHKKIQNCYGSFEPNNGFHTFRKATLEEIQMLEPKKDYEILSFFNTTNKCIFYKIKDGKYSSFKEAEIGTFKEDEVLCMSHFTIHSVKRLSDGEVFTIGDEINFNNIGTGKLLEIQFEVAPIDKGTGRLCFVHNHKTLGRWWNINELSKINSVLFTTDYEILKIKRKTDNEIFEVGESIKQGTIKSIVVKNNEIGLEIS